VSVSLIGAPGRNVIVSPNGKRTRILLVDVWKKILRLMKEAKAEGFVAHFTCPDCREPIRMTSPHPTSPRLECPCTQWIGR
jgi:hypothetical protein